LSAVRLTRLPQAKRGTQPQRLLYLNPQPDITPIITMPIAALQNASTGQVRRGAATSPLTAFAQLSVEQIDGTSEKGGG
jgi:hypothetical protein